MDTSRRKHERVDSLGRCFAQLGDGWEGSVLNMSLGGILLRLKRLLKPGSSYLLKLHVGDQVAIVEARVVRLVPSDGECLAGMEFLRVAPHDRALIRLFTGN